MHLLYNNRFVSGLFHTTIHCLRRELVGCETVLDLGSGPDSPLRHCYVKYSLGVDAHRPYIESSKRRGIHTDSVQADFTMLEFPPKSFDAVVMIGVLEHLTRENGLKMLEKAENIARKKVIVSCPNGFLPQSAHDHNPWQVHLSGWTPTEMAQRGYKVYGMSGWAALRKENSPQTSLEDKKMGDLYSTIRYWPKRFWFLVTAASQVLTYYAPSLSFEMFCAKTVARPPRKAPTEVYVLTS